MAGDWIKVEHATVKKPEVLRIARILGVTPHDSFGKCMAFWIWVDQNCEYGEVDGVVSTDVDAIVDCPGFAKALEIVCWVKFDDVHEVMQITNFEDHNGQTAKTRGLRNKRQSRYRQKVDASVDT